MKIIVEGVLVAVHLFPPNRTDLGIQVNIPFRMRRATKWRPSLVMSSSFPKAQPSRLRPRITAWPFTPVPERKVRRSQRIESWNDILGMIPTQLLDDIEE